MDGNLARAGATCPGSPRLLPCLLLLCAACGSGGGGDEDPAPAGTAAVVGALLIDAEDAFGGRDLTLQLDAAIRCKNHQSPGGLRRGVGGYSTHPRPMLDSLPFSDFGSVVARKVG
jgi:hypothetical protein